VTCSLRGRKTADFPDFGLPLMIFVKWNRRHSEVHRLDALGQPHARKPFAAKVERLIGRSTEIQRIRRGRQPANSRSIYL
jgi:hypothetical protein